MSEENKENQEKEEIIELDDEIKTGKRWYKNI